MAALSRLLVAATIAVAACRARPPAPLKGTGTGGGDDVTLYRDGALIRQRIELDLPATPTTVKATLASGVAADQIVVLDRGGLQITSVRAKTIPDDAGDAANEEVTTEYVSEDYLGGDPDRIDVELPPGVEDREGEEAGSDVVEDNPAARQRQKPTELTLTVQAPRAGKYAVVIGYTTTRLRWDVAYTMTAAVTRDRAELRGALAIRNETGITIRTSTARLIDAELVAWRGKTAEHLAARLVGGTQSSTPPATPRELGRMTLGDGETRVDLVANGNRRMRSVLVYDPIGTKLDNPGASPLRDPTLGATEKAPKRVSESFEVSRDTRGTQGLPAGPVRLLERRPDGSLKVIGESRLFDASTRVSDVDTIAVGTADGVTATRERREITIDDEAHRLTEEFVITIDNTRAIPVEVLVREHLYRGQNWTLAYHSAPEATKDGPQQISLRSRVPAKSKQKILYVVVYTWTQ
jgi:hypothetical protein